MARRKNNGDVVSFFLSIVVAIILMVALMAYISAFIYGFILIIPCLYYAFIGGKKTMKGIGLYNVAYSEYSAAQSRLSHFESSYSDLNITKSGLYDERSYRGKRANKDIAVARENLEASYETLNNLLRPYANAVFVHISIYLYFSTAIILYVYNVDITAILLVSFVVAIIGSLYARSRALTRVKSGNIISRQLPQITKFSSVLMCSFWFIGIIFVYFSILEPSRIQMISAVEGDMVSDSGDMVSDSNIAHQINPNDIEQEGYSLPSTESTSVDSNVGKGDQSLKADSNLQDDIASMDGFLLVETQARLNLGDDTQIIKLNKGLEISLIGKTQDGMWYKILYGSAKDIAYVPVENVGTFTGR